MQNAALTKKTKEFNFKCYLNNSSSEVQSTFYFINFNECLNKMIRIVALIIILFSAVALFFILYSALGNTASLIFADSQLGTYLDNPNVNSYGQNLVSNPYGLIASSDAGIIQYEIT